ADPAVGDRPLPAALLTPPSGRGPRRVEASGDLAAQLDRVRLGSGTLYDLIGAIAAAPALVRGLEGVVDLLTKAPACHACFVYLRIDDRLRLRAASRVYAHLVGRIEVGIDEGLPGGAG